MPTDSERGGLISTMVNKISSMEEWIRNHKSVDHNIYTNTKFRVYRNAAQNTAAFAFTKINFDTSSYDSGPDFDITVNFQFTAPINGYYHFNARASILAAGMVFSVLSLFSNGAEISRGNDLRVPGGADNPGLAVSDDLFLFSGDTVDVRIFNATIQPIEVGNVFTYFSGFLISSK